MKTLPLPQIKESRAATTIIAQFEELGSEDIEI